MVILLALLLVAGTQAAPSASPRADAPLKTILNERVSPLCSVLHQDVASAVIEIRTNDLHFERAAALFLGVQEGVRYKSEGTVGMSMMNLETEERRIAESIIRTETLLGDARFERAAQADPAVAKLKTQLSELTKLQNDELNVISGPVETYANGLGTIAVSSAPLTHDQQLALEHPPTDPPEAQMSSTDSMIYRRLHHLTAFDIAGASFKFAHLLAKGQIEEQPIERAAASSILDLAGACQR